MCYNSNWLRRVPFGINGAKSFPGCCTSRSARMKSILERLFRVKGEKGEKLFGFKSFDIVGALKLSRISVTVCY